MNSNQKESEMTSYTTLKITALLLVSSLFVEAVAFGEKAVIGITRVETAAQNISCEGWGLIAERDCNENLSKGFTAMLETSIVKSGKMDVMERMQWDAVLKEQLYGQESLTDSGGKVGGLTGVDYLVYGTITKFGARQSGFSIGTDTGLGSLFGDRTRQGLGEGLGTGKVTTEMAVDLKLTEVSTGKIILADTVDGEVQEGSSFSIGGIQSVKSSADPYADVQRVVAAKISEVIVTTQIPIKVIHVQENGTLILNYGNVFFANGQWRLLGPL